MFSIDHRKGNTSIGHQWVRAMTVNEALANARQQAVALGADYLTIFNAEGELVGVFNTQSLQGGAA